MGEAKAGSSHSDGGAGAEEEGSDYFGFTDDRAPGRFYLSLDLTQTLDRPVLMVLLQVSHLTRPHTHSRPRHTSTLSTSYPRTYMYLLGSSLHDARVLRPTTRSRPRAATTRPQ